MKKRVKLEYGGLIALLFLVGFIFYFAGDIRLTGYAIINGSSFSSSVDFSSGTYTNTTFFNGNIKLNILVPVGDYVDSDPPYSIDNAQGVFVVGDYAYVTSNADDSLTIIDITDKSNPVGVGDYVANSPPNSIEAPQDLYISGNFAYVTSTADDTLTIIDITDKSNPVGVGDYANVFPPNSIELPQDVYILGDFAYVTSSADDGLTIINITNKSNPIPVGDYVDFEGLLNNAVGVFASEDFAYVVGTLGDAFTILNISNKSNPTLVGNYTDSVALDGAHEFFISGDLVYVAASNSDSLTILNISNKSNPTFVGNYNNSDPPYSLDAAIDVHVVGDLAYVTSFFDNSLTVLNVSDPTNPIPIGDYVNDVPPNSIDGARRFFILGDFAYVTSFWDDSLTIIKINESFSSGSYESPIINATYTAKWLNISWSGTEPTNTNLTIAYKSCNDSACSGESYGSYTNNTLIDLSVSNNQYFQFKVNFNTTNLSVSPKFNSINIFYTDDITAPTATLTCTPSPAVVGDIITCTCSGTDSDGLGINDPLTSSSTTITATESGTFTVSGCTVTDLAGNSASTTGTYTVLGSGGGGSSVGGGGSTPSVEKKHLLVEVNSGELITISTFEDTGVSEVTIEVSQDSQNVRIKVARYDQKPTVVSIGVSGKVYRYLEISIENVEEILDKAKVTFEVEKSWVLNNSLEKDEIIILKFDEQNENWNELETTFSKEDDNFYFYSIELDSFSYFAIGEKSKIPVVLDIVDVVTGSYDYAKQTKYRLIIWWSVFVAFLVGIFALCFLVLRKLNLIKKESDTYQSIRYGRTFEKEEKIKESNRN